MSNQTPLERYHAALATGNFSEDEVQRQAMTYLDNLYHELITADGATKQGFFC